MTPKTPQENKALAQARTLALLREKLATVEKEREEWRVEALQRRNALETLEFKSKVQINELIVNLRDAQKDLEASDTRFNNLQNQYQSAIRREQNLILAHAQLKNEATMRLERWGKHTLECAKRHRLGPCDCGFDGAKVFV